MDIVGWELETDVRGVAMKWRKISFFNSLCSM